MSDTKKYSRRHFLQSLALGGGGLIVLGSFGFRITKDHETNEIKAIAVDFSKCAGCRTCETACSAFNNKVKVNGEKLDGLGNPHYSNIKVHHFNPDVDVPVTCALCDDTPCVEACPVDPDVLTGRKALYRDKDMTIKNDKDRCIGCASCAEACKELRGGVIYPNPETGMPERICTLCNGNPSCVSVCPFDALTFIKIPADRDLEGLSPEKIAKRLIKELYNLNV